MAPSPTPHLSHLTHLHSLLLLPAASLTDDLTRIDEAMKAAVEGVVRQREAEVMEWEEKIEGIRSRVIGLSRVLGEEKLLDGEAHKEKEQMIPLPTIHTNLLTRFSTLRASYQTRQGHLSQLQHSLLLLSRSLGPSFLVPEELLPSPILTAEKELDGADSSEDWEEVGVEREQAIQKWILLCQEEQTRRKQAFHELLLTLLWLHFDLSLPALSSPSFPPVLLPSTATVTNTHRTQLGGWMEKNMPMDEEEEVDGMKGESLDGDAVEEDSKGGALREWCTEVYELWTAEKQFRQSTIQELYDELEPIWSRLGVEEEEREGFVERNRGLADWVVKAYQRELDRVTKLRRDNLAGYVEEVRSEIRGSWEGLMYGEEDKGVFAAFNNDDYSESLLTLHEQESARLRSELSVKSALIPKVRAWLVLREEAEELERTMKDPMRFAKARGGAMLREERMRKRIEVVKPKAEQELLGLLVQWEEENDQLFFALGERVLDVIAEDIEVRELEKAEKEAKKKGRAPLAPTPARVPKPLPTKTPSSTATATSRKRQAPSATPTPATNTKRPRLGMEPSLNASTSSNPSGSTRPGSVAPPSCGLPRPMQKMKTSTSAPGPIAGRSGPDGALGATSGRENLGHVKSVSGNIVKTLGGGKGEVKKARRESFKPRQSVGGFKGALGKMAATADWEMVEEEAEVESSEDVF